MVVICSSFLSLSWLSSKMVSFFIPSRWSEWCDLCLPKKWIVFTTACRLCMCVCCVLYVYILYSRPPKMCGSYPNSGPLFHPVQLNQISFTWWCLSVMRPFCSRFALLLLDHPVRWRFRSGKNLGNKWKNHQNITSVQSNIWPIIVFCSALLS